MSTITSKFTEFVNASNYDVKSHQVEGFEWCYNREKVSADYGGGLLCDEMGLGKTMMMISCIKLNPQPNTLIVVPKSLISQWKSKIKLLLKKTPFIFHGAAAKMFTSNYDIEEQKQQLSSKIFITTYGMLKSVIKEVRWSRVIYDEAHNMRTKTTRNFKHALKLDAKIKWMVTGTPIQNSWSDVLNLCKLLKFPEGEGVLDKNTDIEDQREYIQSIMLVRTKKDVKIKMPKLKVDIVKVTPEAEERDLMSDIHSRIMCMKLNKTRLSYPVIDKIGTCHLTYLIRAKQVCSHPKMVEKCILKESDERNDLIPDFNKITASKLTKLVETVVSQKKDIKKLVFYTYNAEMRFIKTKLESKGYSVAVVNGKTTSKNKASILESKCYDVLLAQIKSGSDGLNLQQYGQVYFVSPHWNPAVEKQAIARIFRIGQLASKVNVFYFVSTFDIKGQYSLDEYCMDIKRTKQEKIEYLFEKED